ncbi:NAD(P)-binding domain-containing protein [Streptomyces sp. R302]|uniref:nuclear transport factor 2 family protein n=1 Tax=unclassified Streptomyces TaxID=2593676 RepID=UPI00145FBE6F|nr:MULTISPECIES: nuclear transport factor 2 family protein [unclassified Streptomyces]NML55421.1 NAD(P)-binding domain-containing protein [Streptomyces sp. R301]NML79659.1 NAD(P)-binding domain-containing protein [Streptomyces sp. R302]
MTAPQNITVLGLGRMGTAIATRLAATGADVTGWTRSGGPHEARAPGRFAAVPEAKEAVAGADVVLLALFDAAACREVLDAVDGVVPADAVIVNTATIAPDEAAALARRPGPAYVHAPVLGSVPAVAAGAVTFLAAAEEPAALDRVRPVLEALGTVRPVDGAATAAALKLVANHSLAGAVLALRDALHQADALGLPRDQALDVLERGQLGGLVSRKRRYLQDGPPPATAEFTIGALAKDLALLAGASRLPVRGGTAPFATPTAASDADIALAATLPAAPDAAVLAPLRAYVRGHATGDPRHFREAFLPTAHIEGIRDSVFVSWPLDEYCALFRGRPAPDEATRVRRVDTVDVHGTVATATMTLLHGPDTFTDVFLLVRTGGTWRIANKAYHRHPAPAASSSAR